MSKDNLPLALIERNREKLDLKDPIVFDNEEILFEKRNTEAKSAIVFLPKSKGLIDMTLAFASKAVSPNGEIVLVGANDAGIRSANKAYENNIGPIEEKIVGNHSALYIGKNKKIAADKKIEDYLTFTPLSYTHGETEIDFEIASLPGVFNAGKFDAGSKFLLDNIPYDKKRVLDVGCGSGILGLLYKKISPSTEIYMCDKSKIAQKTSKETIKKNNVEAVIFESDVLSNVTTQTREKFDLIISNPPFHTGISTDYAFIETLARDIKNVLDKKGELYIVANSFIPYEKTLETHIGPTSIIKDNGKFKVIKTTFR